MTSPTKFRQACVAPPSPQKSTHVNDMHHNLGFSFFLFCKPANPKMQRQLPSFERKMPCGFRILRRNSNHLGHFAYPPGETSLLSSVSTAAGSATFVATRHCFFEPKCRPLRCSSSGYRGAHHRVTAGGARSSGPITSVRQVRPDAWESCSNQPNFCDFAPALARFGHLENYSLHPFVDC